MKILNLIFNYIFKFFIIFSFFFISYKLYILFLHQIEILSLINEIRMQNFQLNKLNDVISHYIREDENEQFKYTTVKINNYLKISQSILKSNYMYLQYKNIKTNSNLESEPNIFTI